MHSTGREIEKACSSNTTSSIAWQVQVVPLLPPAPKWGLCPPAPPPHRCLCKSPPAIILQLCYHHHFLSSLSNFVIWIFATCFQIIFSQSHWQAMPISAFYYATLHWYWIIVQSDKRIGISERPLPSDSFMCLVAQKNLVRLCWWFWWWCTLGILFQVGGRVRCKVAACDGYPSSVRRLISSFRKSPVCRSEIIQGRHCTSKDKELKTRIVLSQLVIFIVNPQLVWRCPIRGMLQLLMLTLLPADSILRAVTDPGQLGRCYPKLSFSWLQKWKSAD